MSTRLIDSERDAIFQRIDDGYHMAIKGQVFEDVLRLRSHCTALEAELQEARALIAEHRCLPKKVVDDYRTKLIAVVREQETYFQRESERALYEARRQRTSGRAWMAAEIIKLIEATEP